MKDLAIRAMERMAKKGVNPFQVRMFSVKRQIMSVLYGRISLLRSEDDNQMEVKAILGGKLGMALDNGIDESSVDNLCDRAIAMADGSVVDTAYDTASFSERELFDHGPTGFDLDMMHERFEELIKTTKNFHPGLKMEKGQLGYEEKKSVFLNSNKVEYHERTAHYKGAFCFVAKENKRVSPFNYTSFGSTKLSHPLLEKCNIKDILNQTVDQLSPKTLTGKFKGDVIFSPLCLMGFVEFISGFLQDAYIVGKRGFLVDKLNRAFASSKFTLTSSPCDSADPCFVSSDGFKTKKTTIIHQGVLKSFMLSLYGANKTKFPRYTGMNSFEVEPGDISFEKQIQKVERGILIGYYSGGRPNDQGDFSGIAKNSYYIENGKIIHPLSETMISGNLQEMLHGILDISSERIDFGYGIFPWMRAGGLTISGK